MIPLQPRSRSSERGAALLLSLLVLFVLVAIVFQLSIGTNTDARVGRNDVSITMMEMAIESALLEVEQQLITDAEGSEDEAAGGDLGAEGADPEAGPEDGAGEEGLGGEEGAAEGPTDSKEDEFLKPQRTEINNIKLRILVQDEDGKFNVLALADPDEALADEAEERLARILDLAREDTLADISSSDAEEMAREMREFLMRRSSSDLARPSLMTDDEEREDVGFPLSLREFGVLESFPDNAFREFRDEDGVIVHSLEAYLTVWSALTTGITLINARAANSVEGGGTPEGTVTQNEDGTQTATGGSADSGSTIGSDGGGYTININTAPPAVLKGFFDSSVVDISFWDDVIEYRNFEEEEEEGEEEEEEEEEQYDEYGNLIYRRQIFDSVDELSEIESYESLSDETKEELTARLRVASDVFTVTIAAMRSTAAGGDEFGGGFIDTDRREDDERQAGTSLMRVVRAVYWRRSTEDEVTVVPLVRWEVLDYVPYEVRDFPEGEER